jgi:hypothetical protein
MSDSNLKKFEIVIKVIRLKNKNSTLIDVLDYTIKFSLNMKEFEKIQHHFVSFYLDTNGTLLCPNKENLYYLDNTVHKTLRFEKINKQLILTAVNPDCETCNEIHYLAKIFKFIENIFGEFGIKITNQNLFVESSTGGLVKSIYDFFGIEQEKSLL